MCYGLYKTASYLFNGHNLRYLTDAENSKVFSFYIMIFPSCVSVNENVNKTKSFSILGSFFLLYIKKNSNSSESTLQFVDIMQISVV